MRDTEVLICPVFDVLSSPARFIWGWAEVDRGADLITVTANGRSITHQIGGMPLWVLARHLLRTLHKAPDALQ
jgi:hypothetical protein